MRSGNPTLHASTFHTVLSDGGAVMTLGGTVQRCFILISFVLLTGAYGWYSTMEALYTGDNARMDTLETILVWAVLAGLVTGFVTVFKKEWAPALAPVYALIEGAFLGILSAIFEARYPGIVFQAVALTIGIFLGLLLAYTSGLIKPSENFKLGIVAATGGIALVYFLNMGLSMFGGISIPMIHETGTFGILFSLFVVVIAALNLVLDFDFIEEGCEAGAPKYMEWYAAFGLLVTLIWLYLEILRLLAKLRSR